MGQSFVPAAATDGEQGDLEAQTRPSGPFLPVTAQAQSVRPLLIAKRVVSNDQVFHLPRAIP